MVRLLEATKPAYDALSEQNSQSNATGNLANHSPWLLSAEQEQSLKALGIEIAVPTYVPPSFVVADVQVDRGRFGPGYTILYRDPQRTCFVVMSGGGLGGPTSEFVYPVRTDLLGSGTINFGKIPGDEKTPGPQDLAQPQPDIYAWMVRSPSTAYSVQTAEWHDGCGPNRSLTPLDIQKILQSLVWL